VENDRCYYTPCKFLGTQIFFSAVGRYLKIHEIWRTGSHGKWLDEIGMIVKTRRLNLKTENIQKNHKKIKGKECKKQRMEPPSSDLSVSKPSKPSRIVTSAQQTCRQQL